MIDRGLKEAALRAVRRGSSACGYVREHWSVGSSQTKDDRSPVTVADYAVQAVVSETLHREFPDIPIVGEETADALRSEASSQIRGEVMKAIAASGLDLDEHSALEAIDRCSAEGGAEGNFWVIDPIDGTKGFLRGGQYAIALALLDRGSPTLGLLGCPALTSSSGAVGALFEAEAGKGTRELSLVDEGAAGTELRVVGTTDSSIANFCESVEAAHSAHSVTARIAELLSVSAPPVRIDSQCKYATVARGDAAIYLRLPTNAEYREKIWDHAAGALIVEEAGGKVTDMTGQALDFSLGRRLEANRGIIATNGRLHRGVLAAVNAAITEETSPQ